MKRRTLLAAGGGAMIAGTIPRLAFAQEAEGPEVVEMVRGSAEASVEVIEYASYTCPHCASFHANQLPALQANYIDTGLVRFVYREVYFDRPGLWASMIARCPGDQDFFFAFTSLLYEQQRAWLGSGDPAIIVEELRRMAKTVGLDDASLDACLSDAAKAETLFNWYQANAERDGITGTPSFMINGQKYANMAYDDFAAILDEKLG